MALLSKRFSRVKPSPIMALANICQNHTHKDLINLSVGEPDASTPQFIKEAGIRAILKDKTKYTPIEGILPLRQAIAGKLKRENKLIYGSSNVIVCSGTKQVIFNAFMATLDPNDEVIIPSPYWASYPDIVLLAGGTPCIVPSSLENNFKITPETLEKAITPKTKWLILNSPSNPTGAVYSEEELIALGSVLENYPQIYILCDDIYEDIVFDSDFVNLATAKPNLQERILVVNGVSKAYAMTGWRIGYGAGSKELIDAMRTVQSQITTCSVSISQEAAVAALTGDQSFLLEQKKIFQLRRDLAFDILNQSPGLKCVKPAGAFYFYLSCEGILGKKTPQGQVLNSDKDVVSYLLESAGVVVVQGGAFGLSPYFRISFAVETEKLKKGCLQIKQALENLR